MNESDIEEPMEEKAINKNGKHAEAEDEVTYWSSSGDEDFADKKFPEKTSS